MSSLEIIDDRQALRGDMNSVSWEVDFPSGFGHTSISFLKRCPGYEDAKKGDKSAAQFVVSRCVKYNQLKVVCERYPNAVLLPVISNNQLPLALAESIGLPVCKSVCTLQDKSRKSMRAIDRLLHKPMFTGSINVGVSYILVDDVITQGGTISALRSFVITHGGWVVAVVALAFAIGSHAIAPLKSQRIRLFLKFGFILIVILQEYNIASTIQELTYSQAKYLLRFSNVTNIRARLSAV